MRRKEVHWLKTNRRWFTGGFLILIAIVAFTTIGSKSELLHPTRIAMKNGKIFIASERCKNSNKIDGPSLIVQAIYMDSWMAKRELFWWPFGFTTTSKKFPVVSEILRYVYPNEKINDELGVLRFLGFSTLKRECTLWEFYLNNVRFGGQTYGLKSAASRFFNKPQNKLSVGEIAILVRFVQYPDFYSYKARPDILLKDRNDLIDQLAREHLITFEQAKSAKQEPIQFH